jgi:hypothetical protein
MSIFRSTILLAGVAATLMLTSCGSVPTASTSLDPETTSLTEEATEATSLVSKKRAGNSDRVFTIANTRANLSIAANLGLVYIRATVVAGNLGSVLLPLPGYLADGEIDPTETAAITTEITALQDSLSVLDEQANESLNRVTNLQPQDPDLQNAQRNAIALFQEFASGSPSLWNDLNDLAVNIQAAAIAGDVAAIQEILANDVPALGSQLLSILDQTTTLYGDLQKRNETVLARCTELFDDRKICDRIPVLPELNLVNDVEAFLTIATVTTQTSLETVALTDELTLLGAEITEALEDNVISPTEVLSIQALVTDLEGDLAQLSSNITSATTRVSNLEPNAEELISAQLNAGIAFAANQTLVNSIVSRVVNPLKSLPPQGLTVVQFLGIFDLKALFDLIPQITASVQNYGAVVEDLVDYIESIRPDQGEQIAEFERIDRIQF